MIYSNERKLALSGWLQNNSIDEFYTPIKLQKYLFIYECISKIENEEVDFSRLEGWRNGPAFSSVWGDYTYNKVEFTRESKTSYENNRNLVNSQRARKSAFIVKISNEKELSDLTHQFTIWNKRKKDIESGVKHVQLYESDFSRDDEEIIKTLISVYDDEIIDNSEVFSIEDKTFIISLEDYKKLNKKHELALQEIVENHANTLSNPVYLEIDEDGVLLID